MGAPQFKHANSPSEIAKREAEQAAGGPPKAKGFMHYNHPDAVAARARAAAGEGKSTPPPELPSVRDAVVPAGAAVVPVPGAAASVPGSTALARLRALEDTVRELEADVAASDLDPDTVQALNLILRNFPGVQASQLELGNRLTAAERTLDLWAEHFGEAPPEPAEDAPTNESTDEAAARVANMPAPPAPPATPEA